MLPRNISDRAVCVLLAMMLAAPAAGEDLRPQRDRHEHGRAFVTLAQTGPALHAELRLPGVSGPGFEGPPPDAGARERLAGILARLQTGDWLETAADAACTGGRARIEARGFGPLDSLDVNTTPAARPGHATVIATVDRICSRPEALIWVELDLFEALEALEKLDVGYFTERGQGQVVLQPGDNRLVPGPP